MEQLLADIEIFLSETGMGPAYFGQVAARDSTLLKRLRRGGRVWPDKETEIRSFMNGRRNSAASRETQNG